MPLLPEPLLVANVDSLRILHDVEKSFRLGAVSNNPVDWKATPAAAWIEIIPSSGTLEREEKIINVRANVAGMEPRVYNESITFSSDQAKNLTIPAIVTVFDQPDFEVFPLTLDFPDTLTSRILTIVNHGKGVSEWSLYSGQGISFFPNEGSLSSGDSVVVVITIDKTRLTRGEHNINLILRNRTQIIRIPLYISVLPMPSFKTDPDIVHFLMWQEQAFLTLHNTGNIDLSIQVGDLPSYLSIQLADNIVAIGDSTQFTFFVDRMSLEVGDHIWDMIIDTEQGFSDTVGIIVTHEWDPALWALNFAVIDAEYNRSTDCLVAIGSNPDRLYKINPAGREVYSIDLLRTPSVISVRPDGQKVAVASSSFLSVIDLTSMSITTNLHTPVDPTDVILAGNDWVYFFCEHHTGYAYPLDQSAVHDTLRGFFFRERFNGLIAVMHPSEKYIYCLSDGSPRDLHKISIIDGIPQYMNDSPYHGTYSMGWGLWMMEGGGQIITGWDGEIFHASENTGLDLTYAGKLEFTSGPSGPGNHIEWLDDSYDAGVIYSLIDYSAYFQPPAFRIIVHDWNSYNWIEEIPLPMIHGPEGIQRDPRFAVFASFGFFNASVSEYYVIMQAEPASHLKYEWRIATFNTGF